MSQWSCRCRDGHRPSRRFLRAVKFEALDRSNQCRRAALHGAVFQRNVAARHIGLAAVDRKPLRADCIACARGDVNMIGILDARRSRRHDIDNAVIANRPDLRAVEIYRRARNIDRMVRARHSLNLAMELYIVPARR